MQDGKHLNCLSKRRARFIAFSHTTRPPTSESGPAIISALYTSALSSQMVTGPLLHSSTLPASVLLLHLPRFWVVYTRGKSKLANSHARNDLVNSANVRRFLRRMGGNRRETGEATSQTSVKWRKPAGCCTHLLYIRRRATSVSTHARLSSSQAEARRLIFKRQESGRGCEQDRRSFLRLCMLCSSTRASK
jgi:hypothetical protein